MIKENDMLLNVLANQDFSVTDFQAVGLNASNTSLRSEDEYKQSDKITSRSEFQTDGKFDEAKFHDWYVGTAQMYNQLSTTDYDKAVMDMAQYDMDNIWVDSHKRTKDNKPKLVSVVNENLTTYGLDAVGKRGQRTLSQREIAQTQKVYNVETGEWEDSPNDSWFGHFTDTLVLATYDEDEYDENGNLIHQKGQRKLNEEGLPYYETLGGRNVYGKQVLNKLDTLTRDGSKANRFDFFDADDLEQKSFVGTLMRNAALVGSMFIGGPVGPIVRGLSVATQAAGLLATIGKLGAGNDNKLLNNIQGWAKTVNRQSQTDYAAQNTWCMENFLNMIGDTVGQLAEQRFLFEYVPAAIKGSGREGWKVMAGGKKGQEEIIAKKAGEYLSDSKKISDFLTDNAVKHSEIGKLNQALGATAQKYGRKYVDDIINSHQKLGEVISKAYMTGITVQDTYGEAKAAGASDMEAALLTLGYAAAEVKLLNSELGSWILPELHGEKFRNKAVVEGLTKVRQKVAPAIAAGGEAAKDAKRSFVQSVIDLGKDFFNGNIARQAMESGTTKGLKVIGAHALGEAFEETSEELLADMSKSVFNVVRWIRGEDALDMGQWDNLGDRYGMSALGGFFGGGITSAATDFSVAKQLSNMNQTEAMQELLYIVNNGKEEEFLRDVDKMTVSDKNLSAFEPIEVNGETVAWAEAKEGEDQDTIAKKLIRKQVNTLKDILTTERARISTDSLLNKLAGADSEGIINDVLFGKLRESNALKLFAQDFQLMQDNLVKAKAELIAAETKATDTSEVDQNKVSKAKELLKLRQEEIKRYLEGTVVPHAVRNAAYEINSSLHGGFDLHLDKESYAKYKTTVDYADLSDKEKEEIDEAYNLYLNTQASDDINIAAQAFYDMIETATPVALAYGERLKLEKQNMPEQINPVDWTTKMLDILSMDREQLAKVEGVDSIDQDQYLEFIQKKLDQFQGGMLEATGLITPELIQRHAELELNYEEGDEKAKKKAHEESEFFINDQIFDRLDPYLKPLLQVEYMHPEVKNSILQLLKKQRQITKQLADGVNSQSNQLYYHPLLEGLNPFQEDHKRDELSRTYRDRVKVYDQYIEEVENLANTPVLELLDQFKTASINSDVKVSQHVQKTQEILDGSMKELDDFIQQEEWEKTNDEAIRVINSFIAVMEGMKTDNADFDNPTGYATLINAISRKYGVKDFVPLAELDSETANMIIQDAKTIRDKLIFARNLSDNNKGQKLKQQDKVAGRKNIILFKNYQRFVNALPDDWVSKESGISAKQKLQSILDNSLHMQSFIKDDIIKLNKEQKYQSAKELQQIDDAIYEIFDANKKADGTFDEDKLATFIESLAGVGGFFQKTGDMLLEDSKDIDMNSFIWNLAVKASLKTSDYLGAYQKGLTPKIAAIPSQELGVQFGVAALVNMKGLNQWTRAYRKAIMHTFDNLDEKGKKDALERFSAKNDPFATQLSKYFASHDSVPQFLNMIFFEGGPGTGKSGGIYTMITNIAKTIDPNVLNKAMFVHATDASAEKSGEKLGIKLAKGREKFLSWVSSEWKDTKHNTKIINGEKRRYLYEGSYTFDENGQLVNTWKLNEYSEDELPKFIFIDEVSHYNQQELSMIEQFARKNGIVVFTAGDLDQDKQIVHVKNPEDPKDSSKDIGVIVNRNFFPRIPKLGLSLRTRNRQMTNNTVMLQTMLTDLRHNKKIKNIQFTYLDNDPKHKGLYGVKSFNQNNGVTDEVKATIQLMIDTLKPEEKIGFMYYDENSALYKYIMENFSDKVERFLDSDAQGLEGQYYIIDVDPSLKDSDKSYISRLYTGITRAEQGALAFVDQDQAIKSVLDPVYFEENLSEQAILKSSKDREEEIARQLQDVEIKPLTINYIDKEDIEIKEAEKRPDEDDELNVPDVAEEIVIPEKYGDGYTKQELAQAEIDDLLSKIGSDLSKLEAVDSTKPDSQKFDIESIEIKESEHEGTKIWIPTITLKTDEGVLAENTLSNFLKDFTIVNKENEEILPLYNIGDRLTINNGAYKNIQIESLDTTDGNIIYNVTNLEDGSTENISQKDIQESFVEYYNPDTETTVEEDETVVDSGMSNYTDEEVLNTVDFLNRDEIEQDIEGERLTQFLYTHNTHETGGINLAGNFSYSVRGSKRIDNGNGLVKILGAKRYDEVEEILGEMRGKAYHESNSELSKYFRDQFGVEVEVDWAFKSSSEDNEHRNPKYQRMAVAEDEQEVLSYIHVDKEFEELAKKPMRKKLMLRVKDKGTNKFIFELSVASLNSPLTVLFKKQNDEYIFAPFVKTFSDAYKRNESEYEGIKAVVDTYYENKDRLSPVERDLLELCKFWTFTSDGIFPMSKDFNLSELNGTGPIYTMQKGNNQLNKELQSTNKLIDLEEYAKNKAIHISSVMISKDGKVGGVTDRNLHKGLAFVLVSDNPKFVTDYAMEEQYRRQILQEALGHPIKEEVRLKYITLPKVGVREWMHNQQALYRQKLGYADESFDIGDKFTVFRILEAIQKSGHSLKELNSSYGSESIIEKYLNKLYEIEQKWSEPDLVFTDSIQEANYNSYLKAIGDKRARRKMKLEEQLTYLNSEVNLEEDKVVTGGKAESLGTTVHDRLTSFISKAVWRTPVGATEPEFNIGNLDNIVNWSKEGGFSDVRFQLRYSHDTDSEIGSFIKAKTTDKYSLGFIKIGGNVIDTNFKINSRIDTSVFSSESLSKEIADFNTRWVHKGDSYRLTPEYYRKHMIPYVELESPTKTTETAKVEVPTKKEEKTLGEQVKSKYPRYASSLDNDILNSDSFGSEVEMLKALAKKYSEKPGQLGIVHNGKLFLTEFKDSEGNNLKIINFEHIVSNDDLAITINRNGEVLRGVLTPSIGSDGNIKNLTLQLYELEPVVSGTSEFVIDQSIVDNIKYLYDNGANRDGLGSYYETIFDESGEVSADLITHYAMSKDEDDVLDLIANLQEIIENAEFFKLDASKLSNLVKRIKNINQTSTGINLEIGDTVLYNNKYYSIMNVDENSVTLIEEQTKEQKSVTNFEDIKKEIKDICNPIKLKLK